ncbi:MAG: haloacid dehalogenase, partial [Gammaproteobacteria bacterium]|nr:haloacid dehalogenase [Gammaproteobacteria bacterium]
MARLTDYRVLTFDCYGTLIDWEAGIWEALQPVIRSNGAAGLTRDEALRAFARFEGQHEHATPDLAYPDLLARVHRDLAGSFGLRTDRELDADFGNAGQRGTEFP